MTTLATQPNTQPGNGRELPRPRPVDPRLERVAGGAFPWLVNYLNILRTLPFFLDDLTRDFGDDIYERMMLDPQVAGDVETLKAGVLAQGWTLTPAIGDEKDPRHAQAQEITDFCARNLESLQESLIDIFYDLLDCVAYGNRVAEIVFRDAAPQETDDYPKAGLWLKSIKPKPRTSLSFVVDSYLNHVGFLARIPGQVYTTLSLVFVGDNPPNLLPRNKFLVLTWKPKSGDPRGRPQLRPVYKPWWDKLQVSLERIKFLARFGSPSLAGMLGEQAQPIPVVDASGMAVIDEVTGLPRITQPLQALYDALLQMHNGTVGAFPPGTVLTVVEAHGEGEAFTAAVDDYNREISKGILGHTLSTNEGKHQARAASESAQDVTNLPVLYGKRMLAAAMKADVLTQLVVLNYGEEVRYLVPDITFAPTEAQDEPAMLTAVAAVYGSGFWDNVTDMKTVDSKIGFDVERDGPLERVPPALADPQAKPGEDPNASSPGGKPDGKRAVYADTGTRYQVQTTYGNPPETWGHASFAGTLSEATGRARSTNDARVVDLRPGKVVWEPPK